MLRRFNLASVSLYLFILGGCVAPRSPAPEGPVAPPLQEPPHLIESGPIQARFSSSKVQDGSILWVDLRFPKEWDSKKLVLRFEKKEIPIFQTAEGVFSGVIGVPYLLKPGTHSLVLDYNAPGAKSDHQEFPVEVFEGQYRSEKLSVNPKHVRPTKKSVLAQVQRDLVAIGAAYRVFTSEKLWSGPFILPIQSEFTSRFGTKRVYNGVHQNSHMGLDLRAPVGTSIHAPEGAVVVLARDTFFLGNMVILDHGFGLKTVYGHMSRLDVKAGDRVTKGQQLGLSGMSGRASGPHLHWMAVVHGEKVDPQFLTTVMK